MGDIWRATAQRGEQIDDGGHGMARGLLWCGHTPFPGSKRLPHLREPLNKLLDQPFLHDRRRIFSLANDTIGESHEALHGRLRDLGVLVGEEDGEGRNAAVHGRVLGLHARDEAGDDVHARLERVLVEVLVVFYQLKNL